MEIKIENILILWDEKVTDIFVSLINTLSLSFSETEIRNSMAKLSENENFGRLWKSHATLTLLAKQDLPTFGYNMIDPLKSWCWGSILFYPFKNSRFS